jgi:hypothetical protein
MGEATNIIVLSFDSKMFEQAQRCLETIREYCRADYDIGVVAIDLKDGELQHLRQQGAKLFTNVSALPSFAEAPRHAYAMTCRPYLKEIFPGYESYMYIDADVRVMNADTFEFYLGGSRQFPQSIAIVQEVDPAYIFIQDPTQARRYHEMKNGRIAVTYGQDAAAYLQYFNCYNAGVFAMHRDAAVWELYRKNLEIAMRGPYHHMLEQDAMLVSIVESGMKALVGPTIMNWLCSISFPRWDEEQKRWVRPIFPYIQIAVLHLTNSGDKIVGHQEGLTWYEHYKRVGITR